jgi:hypothetical protein
MSNTLTRAEVERTYTLLALLAPYTSDTGAQDAAEDAR